jgi:hypothetical protein
LPCVSTDLVASARLAADHFLERGFRHFAYFSLVGLWDVATHQEAFVQAVKTGGRDFASLTVKTQSGSEPDWRLELAKLCEWVKGLPKPVATVCWNVSSARAIFLGCQEVGLHVPEEVAVLSQADDDVLCEATHIDGPESYPRAAFDCWQAVEQNPWVIGDFVWTGFDYLGESGIGHARLDNEPGDFGRPWPWFNAFCSDLVICGFKKPQSLYRDVLWRRSPLGILIHMPLPSGCGEKVSDWGWPDELPSWTWPGQEGKPMQVAIYTRRDTVRLELNGKQIATKQVSPDAKLTARFEVPYAPGELRAIGFLNGKQVTAKPLRSAGPPARLRLTADRTPIRADRNDLCYVTVEVTDTAGNLVPSAAIPVRIAVSGPGELAAVGSGNPREPASFREPVRTTFQGRCLAILRPTSGPGAIRLRAEADGLKSTMVSIGTK